MLSLGYVTNLSYDAQSGGGSGVNQATINQLKKRFSLQLFTPISPKPDYRNKVTSVIKRKLGLKGEYHQFSPRRLDQINKLFKLKDQSQALDALFFHGFTPWIRIRTRVPYYCFNDACFASYVEHYNNSAEFLTDDLNRIYEEEAQWLCGASSVFFRSQWALEETKRHYNLNCSNFYNVGVGGFIDIPEKDTYRTGLNFLFIAREFSPKGGDVVVDALKIVKHSHPEASLWVVGERPPSSILNREGVVYKGFYYKHIPDQRQKLISLMASAFALVHPTTKDTNTLVISELAYFGCPAIASNRFAIPEYLHDEQSGYLLDEPRNSKSLAKLMCRMIENPREYKLMRKYTRENALANNTWDHVGSRIAKQIMI